VFVLLAYKKSLSLNGHNNCLKFNKIPNLSGLYGGEEEQRML
jgi:hypothetical protein